jgi:hypothetical protein
MPECAPGLIFSCKFNYFCVFVCQLTKKEYKQETFIIPQQFVDFFSDVEIY